MSLEDERELHPGAAFRLLSLRDLDPSFTAGLIRVDSLLSRAPFKELLAALPLVRPVQDISFSWSVPDTPGGTMVGLVLRSSPHGAVQDDKCESVALLNPQWR